MELRGVGRRKMGHSGGQLDNEHQILLTIKLAPQPRPPGFTRGEAILYVVVTGQN